MKIDPYQTIDDLYAAAADSFCQLATECVRSAGTFRVSLSGGSTPKRLYEILSERDLPWANIHWFWGDERNVSHTAADSNYLMVRAALLDRVSVPAANVHPVPVDVDDPAAAAIAYEATLKQHFPGQSMPAWDLALLGMGDDSHTASLFPETKAIGETERWFTENWVEKFDSYRYTLTAPAINSATQSWFLVSGEGKKIALANVLGKTRAPEMYPSQLIHPTRWFVTADAIA